MTSISGPVRIAVCGVEWDDKSVYCASMSNPIDLPRAAWIESMARSDRQLAVGETVPLGLALDAIDDDITELESKLTNGHKTKAARRR